MNNYLSQISPVRKDRPIEATAYCPNCGVLHWASELRHSSFKKIVVESGSICSTLYGVCQKCADNHAK